MVLGRKVSRLGSPSLHPVCEGCCVAATVGSCSKITTTRSRQGSFRAVRSNVGERGISDPGPPSVRLVPASENKGFSSVCLIRNQWFVTSELYLNYFHEKWRFWRGKKVTLPTPFKGITLSFFVCLFTYSFCMSAIIIIVVVLFI